MLADIFPGSVHVTSIGLEHASDEEIWTHAKTTGQTIVTKDADFAQRSFLYGSPPDVVWLRLPNSSTLTIEAVLRRSAIDIGLLQSGTIPAGILIVEA